MENDNVSKNEIGEISPIESKVDLENVKSKNILQLIFNYVPIIESLKIIKYNKKIQNELNLDYKKYSETFTPIVIEIIPFESRIGKIIKIKKEEERKYYHIFFNDSKEEKSDYLAENDKVSLIKIVIDYQVKSLERLFYNCPCIKSITFKKFYRKNITDMNYMFSYNYSLEEINFSSFNTSNVTNMEYMFYKCSSIRLLDLSNFNTSNVTNMHSMFNACYALKEINLSSFNTSNVTNMQSMFYKCSSLEQLDLSNFNTSNVYNMHNMFSECSNLKKLNVLNFDTSNVMDLSYMFFRCYSLKELDLSSFNITKVKKSMDRIFYECSSLEEINLLNFQYKDTMYFERMIYGCSPLLTRKIKEQSKNKA